MHSRFCGELLVFRAQREKGNVYVSLKSIYGSSRKEGIQSQTHMPQKSIGALADVLQEEGLALAILPASKSMGCKWGPQATQRAVANLKSKLPGHFALLWSELPASHCCQAKRNTKHPNTWLMFSVQLCLAYVWQGPPFHRGWETIFFFNECFWLMLESICGFANSFCWFNFNSNKREVPFYMIASSDKQQTLHSPLAFSFICFKTKLHQIVNTFVKKSSMLNPTLLQGRPD